LELFHFRVEAPLELIFKLRVGVTSLTNFVTPTVGVTFYKLFVTPNIYAYN